MATLREIRRQLHSVKNIEKITQAMEMVAASRLRRAQIKAEMSRPYFFKLKELLYRLISMASDLIHPLIQQREEKKIGLVVIAADRGLCGAYNQNIFSATERFLQNYNLEQVELILFGRKAIDYFSRKQWKIQKKILGWGGKITYQQVEELTQDLINQYLNLKTDAIWLIYTHYINLASRKVLINKLLSIDINEETIGEKSSLFNYIFEPDALKIFTEILPRYCFAKVQSALNEAYASELAARIFSMRAATKNAEEMIEKLTLIRNKVRQAGITRDLLEITACVESLK